MTPEGRVKDKIKKWMKRVFPTAFSFMPRQSGFGQNGIPDHLYCVPVKITKAMVGETVGLFVGIEAKTASGTQSALQNICEKDIVAAGGIYLMPFGSDAIDGALSRLMKFYQGSENELSKSV